MKRSKLILAPIITACAIAPVALVTSCNQKTEAELIAEAIYSPLDATGQTITGENGYFEYLKGLNDEDKKACLIYDLFGFFNLKGYRNLPADKSFTSLYKEEKVSIATNITKCEYTVTAENKIKVSVLGYVSLICNQDIMDGTVAKYRTNDYVMITYDILNREVTVNETNCCLVYSPSSSETTEVVGMVKERCGGESAVSKLYYIKSVNPYDDYYFKDNTLPCNFKKISK